MGGNAGDIRITDLIGPAFYGLWRDAVDARHFEYWLGGGRGSTKSSFLSILVAWIIKHEPDAHAVIFRKHKIDIRTSVLAQMVWAIRQLGWENYFSVSVSPAQIIYRPTGQMIIFRGLDDVKKTKSIKVPFGTIKIDWFEELDEFSGYDEIHSVIESTARGGDRCRIFCSYNPPESSANWVNVESTRYNPRRIVHKSDFRRVPAEWLGRDFLREVAEIKKYRPEMYRHTYLGEVTGTGAEVFSNLVARQITQDEIDNFRVKRYGMDFGFTNDPTSLSSVGYDRKYKRLYIWGEWYKYGVFADQIYRDGIEARGLKRNVIKADCAEPRTIAELNRYGAQVYGCHKGKDSIERGMLWLRRRNQIIIDPARCPETWREFSQCEYARMRDGTLRNEYQDRDNHSIDAVRYACEDLINEGSGSRFIIR